MDDLSPTRTPLQNAFARAEAENLTLLEFVRADVPEDFADPRAVAVAVDPDLRPDIYVPTIVAIRGGYDAGRIVASLDGARITALLDAVERGDWLVPYRATAYADPANRAERFQYASLLRRAGYFDEAMREYLWVWRQGVDVAPNFQPVRHSFVAADMELLAARYTPMRDAMIVLRDAIDPPSLDFEVLGDWFSLNRVLGETERSLAWCVSYRPDPTEPRIARLVEMHLVPLLKAADAGTLIGDPMKTLALATEIRARAQLDAELRERYWRRSTTALVRALFAAGRTDEEHAVRAEILRVDPAWTDEVA